MRGLKLMEYKDNYIIGTIVSLGTAFALTTAGASTTIDLKDGYADATQTISYKADYDMFEDYSLEQQSTRGSSLIQNDIEMLKQLEIARFNEKIHSSFDTYIVSHWIPAEGMLDKTCLFVTVDMQEELLSKAGYDFELELYLTLKEEIEESNFFDMIAII